MSIQNYDDDERGLRKAYTPQGGTQQAVFLTSQGVYRLLYNSKKEIAKKFRKWVGNILDDIIFNNSNELKKRLDEKEQELQTKTMLLQEKEAIIQELENKPETEGFTRNPGYVYLITDTSKPGHYKIGYTSDLNKRLSELNVASSTYTLEVSQRFETYDKEFAEKLIHHALLPYRIQNRKRNGFTSEQTLI